MRSKETVRRKGSQKLLRANPLLPGHKDGLGQQLSGRCNNRRSKDVRVSSALEGHPRVDGRRESSISSRPRPKRHNPTKTKSNEGPDAPDIHGPGVIHGVIALGGQVTPQVLQTVLDAARALRQDRLERIPDKAGEVKVG